jgi:hypothetical protein
MHQRRINATSPLKQSGRESISEEHNSENVHPEATTLKDSSS